MAFGRKKKQQQDDGANDCRDMPQYQEGRAYYQPGMGMSRSSDCPHAIGSNSRRQAWMNGFFDAYFQRICDRMGLGDWLAEPAAA